jgi:predicted DNA binding CopG/RHH family protein
MATIDDLKITSLSDMTQDEAFELIKQLRLSRRTSKKPMRKTTIKHTKKQSSSNVLSNLSPNQASKLLKLLGGI